MQLTDNSGTTLYYWKLFADFEAISDKRAALVLTYGKKGESLLIASHIKPWAVATDSEKLDPKNGFMLSPLYDKLFDRGLMTFSEDRRIILSNWISPKNKERLGVKDRQFVQLLPLDEARQSYMQLHRSSVFKG